MNEITTHTTVTYDRCGIYRVTCDRCAFSSDIYGEARADREALRHNRDACLDPLLNRK